MNPSKKRTTLTGSRKRISVRGSGSSNKKVPMAKASRIPAGSYRSEIKAVKEVKTAAGEDAVEVVYKLVDTEGHVYMMREIVPVDGWHFERFCDALIAAGLADGDDLQDAVGIEEDVVLEYPDPKGLGRFKSRKPAEETQTAVSEKKAIPAVADADEEWDDLDFEDDDDE